MSGTIESLDRAKSMAFENSQLYPDVFKTVLPIVYDNDLTLQKWCLNFLIESFANGDHKLPNDLLKSLSVQLLDPLLFLLRIKDVIVVQKSIHLFVLAYDLVFLNVLENGASADSKSNWQKVSDLKQEIIRNFITANPLIPLNKQTDAMRSIGCKLQIIQLIGKIVEIQLPAPPRDPRMRRTASSDAPDISISMIPSNHSVLNNNLEAEGMALLDLLFNFLNEDALVITPLFGAVELVFVKLLKKRSNQVYNKFVNLISVYESDSKKRSKFEEDEAKVKLIKRFNDRFNKILIGFMINKKLIKDSTLQQRLSKKFSNVMIKNDIAKKRGILNDSDDEGENAKRRKVTPPVLESEEIFYNSSPIAKDFRYASLYNLVNPKDTVNRIDLSNISQEILTRMAAVALKKIERNKLVEGLTIVTERYREILSRPRFGNVKDEISGNNFAGEDQEEDNALLGDDIEDLSGVTYDLPIPKALTFDEKKTHLKRVIANFIKLADKEIATGPNISDSLENGQSDLSKVAIPSWNKESWLVLLTRLASRGLAQDDAEEESEKLSDIIREEIFRYFSEDIRNRIDVSIEWLNEEWYTETVKNEHNTSTSPDGVPVDTEDSTPIYIKWAGKVLDTILLFLEGKDRKLFIRLLSDLPFLNRELVRKLKSLCMDPTRFKIGFQSLQFLAIYRPPVKAASIELLKELYEESKDKEEGNDDFKKEIVALIKKLAPDDKLA